MTPRTLTPSTGHRRRGALLAGGLALLAVAGCKEANPVFDPNIPPPGQACLRGARTTQTFAATDPGKLDVLFVVSDSATSRPLQKRLSDAMPAFVADLRRRGLDFQLGVISGDTTQPNVSGSLRTGGEGVAGCDQAPRIITGADGEDAGRFAVCNVQLGTTGPTTQELLEATQIALTSRATQPLEAGGNAGFLRSDAALLLVFVTERDDCSNANATLTGAPDAQTACAWNADQLSPVAEAATVLHALKPDPTRVAVGVLAGSDIVGTVEPPEALPPTCRDPGSANVWPARRLLTLFDLFEPRAHFESICAASYRGLLARTLDRLATPRPQLLCANADMAEAPLAVRATGAEDDTVRQDVDAGYIYLGKTDACPNGAIALSPAALDGVQTIEVDFCGL